VKGFDRADGRTICIFTIDARRRNNIGHL
jgi:hypothetical protein